jgi:hypothetical protein
MELLKIIEIFGIIIEKYIRENIQEISVNEVFKIVKERAGMHKITISEVDNILYFLYMQTQLTKIGDDDTENTCYQLSAINNSGS